MFLCPPSKVREDISVSVRIQFVSTIFLESMGEFYQTCIDTSLGQAKELIKFLVTLTPFSRPQDALDC